MGAVLAVFGAAVIVTALRFPLGVPTDPLGPRAVPAALGAGILLCGALLAAAALLFRGGPQRASALIESGPEGEPEAGPFSPGRLLGAIAATAIYVGAFESLGYLLATPPYVAAILGIHGGASRRSVVLAPLLVTLALYAAFRFGLRIPVPDGILERSLPW